MAGRKKHSAEDVVRKLRRADELPAAGKTNEEIAAELEVSAATSPSTIQKRSTTLEDSIPTMNYARDVKGACYQTDITLVLTEWDEFRNLDPCEIANVVRGQRIIDGRNCLERAKWRNSGWEYRRMGRL